MAASEEDDDFALIMSDYCMPSLSDMSSDSLMTQSQYAKVIFHDLLPVYPTDADIWCRYSVTEGVRIRHGDRVALYRVGWSLVQDHVHFEVAPVPPTAPQAPDTLVELHVVFKAESLPKDTTEYYQLCYVNVKGSVCGASVPFQFRRVVQEELCEVEGEEGLMVVRSRTAVNEAQLREATQVISKLEKLLEETKLTAGMLEKQLEELRDQLKEVKQSEEKLRGELEEANKLEQKLHANIDLGIVARDELQEQLDEAKRVETGLREDLERAIRMEEEYKRDLEGQAKELKEAKLVERKLMRKLAIGQQELEEAKLKAVELEEYKRELEVQAKELQGAKLVERKLMQKLAIREKESEEAKLKAADLEVAKLKAAELSEVVVNMTNQRFEMAAVADVTMNRLRVQLDNMQQMLDASTESKEMATQALHCEQSKVMTLNIEHDKYKFRSQQLEEELVRERRELDRVVQRERQAWETERREWEAELQRKTAESWEQKEQVLHQAFEAKRVEWEDELEQKLNAERQIWREALHAQTYRERQAWEKALRRKQNVEWEARDTEMQMASDKERHRWAAEKDALQREKASLEKSLEQCAQDIARSNDTWVSNANTIMVLRTENAEAKNEITELMNQNFDLRTYSLNQEALDQEKLEIARTESLELKTLNADLKSENAGLKSENAGLKVKISQLKTENDELRSKKGNAAPEPDRRLGAEEATTGDGTQLDLSLTVRIMEAQNRRANLEIRLAEAVAAGERRKARSAETEREILANETRAAELAAEMATDRNSLTLISRKMEDVQEQILRGDRAMDESSYDGDRLWRMSKRAHELEVRVASAVERAHDVDQMLAVLRAEHEDLTDGVQRAAAEERKLTEALIQLEHEERTLEGREEGGKGAGEVAELQRRLEMAAEEYRKVYVQMRRAEKQLAKMKQKKALAGALAERSASPVCGAPAGGGIPEPGYTCVTCSASFPLAATSLFLAHLEDHLS